MKNINVSYRLQIKSDYLSKLKNDPMLKEAGEARTYKELEKALLCRPGMFWEIAKTDKAQALKLSKSDQEFVNTLNTFDDHMCAATFDFISSICSFWWEENVKMLDDNTYFISPVERLFQISKRRSRFKDEAQVDDTVFAEYGIDPVSQAFIRKNSVKFEDFFTYAKIFDVSIHWLLCCSKLCIYTKNITAETIFDIYKLSDSARRKAIENFIIQMMYQTKGVNE